MFPQQLEVDFISRTEQKQSVILVEMASGLSLELSLLGAEEAKKELHQWPFERSISLQQM